MGCNKITNLLGKFTTIIGQKYLISLIELIIKIKTLDLKRIR